MSTNPKQKAAAPNHQLPSRPQSGAKNIYLLTYNALSAALWASILYRVFTLGGHEVNNARKAGLLFGKGGGIMGGMGEGVIVRGLGSGKVYEEMEGWVRGVQTMAGMEVLHSLFGIVRAPLLTTVMQVASRFLLVWGIAHPGMFGVGVRHSPAYSTMLVAWSVTEVIRYSYFVFTLSGVGVPKVWTWLRYNTFLVLYPLGISSECWLVYSAIPLARQRNEGLGYALWAILAVYVPGSYVLFSHMLAQRRKIARQNRN